MTSYILGRYCYSLVIKLVFMLPGALACSNGDTWASELGTVVGRAEPFLITSGQRVPKGKHV
jgi:uncharacterized membrane protein